MSTSDVRTAIFDAISTEWLAEAPAITDTEFPEIRYQNLDDPNGAPSGDYSAEVVVEYDFAGQISMGQAGCRVFMDEGTVTVRIFSPAGTGMEKSDNLSDMVRDVFEGKTISGIRFRNARTNEVGVSGSRFETNVFADFEFERQK